MAEITTKMVKELRERTLAGISDCKKALVECDGDMDKATDFLRKKGLATAAKKSGRVAAEGLVGVAVDGGKGGLERRKVLDSGLGAATGNQYHHQHPATGDGEGCEGKVPASPHEMESNPVYG